MAINKFVDIEIILNAIIKHGIKRQNYLFRILGRLFRWNVTNGQFGNGNHQRFEGVG